MQLQTISPMSNVVLINYVHATMAALQREASTVLLMVLLSAQLARARST
jgi:hypothetical protein